MSKVSKTLSVKDFTSEVIKHYSKLYARRRHEALRRQEKQIASRIKEEVVEDKVASGERVPKQIKKKLESQEETNVMNANIGAKPDKLQEKIHTNARELWNKVYRKRHKAIIDWKKIRRKLEQEIDLAIEREEKRMFQEKIVLKRRRKILRRKQ